MYYKSLLGAVILSTGLTSVQASYEFLDPAHRPPALKEAIDWSFEYHKGCTNAGGSYLFHGQTEYVFVNGVDPVDELTHMIESAKDQKDFHAMDIGAGNFSWGHTTSKRMQGQLLPHQSLHIYSLTGESCGLENRQEGQVHIHNRGQSYIERLGENFMQRFIFKSDEFPKFDLIVSSMTFLHLNDPMGTFVQAYNSLKVGGMIMFDLFPVYMSGTENPDELDWRFNVFLNTTQEPYVCSPWYPGTPRTVILKRTKSEPLALPFKYDMQVPKLEFLHAQPKPRALHKRTADMEQFLHGRVYVLTQGCMLPHQILKGNNHDFFNELYSRTQLWQTTKTEWQSYWVGEKHPDDVREAQKQ